MVFLSSACFASPSKEEKEKERRLTELINAYSNSGNVADTNLEEMAKLTEEPTNNQSLHDDRIDFSKTEAPRDSIDMMLYKLIAYSSKMSDADLIKQIEILINKGANPNALLSISTSARKLGTYIPIIKQFYNNKYRNYSYSATAFHAAVAKGNTKIVQKLIDLGAKTGIPAKTGEYPIDIAVVNNDLKMIDFLLANGSNVKIINLADSKNIALIEKLVKLGADPNTIDINFALEDKTKLKRLLALNPSLQNLKLDFKKLYNDDELLNLLLDNGLPLSTIGTFPDGCPLIFGAVRYDNLKALKTLIDLGANKSERCSNGFGETPLLRAIHYEQVKIVEYLLSIGVSANEKEWTDKSALSNAAETDNNVIINMLIDAGAQIEYDAYFGQTPLMHAVSMKKYVAVETLIKRGANVNHTTKYGETPLVMAIKENDYPIIKLLVENGAKTNIKYDGKTLAAYAKEEEASPMIIKYLKNQ